MNLKQLTDAELDQSFQASALKEREALTDVLIHIVEVERRKLYLKMKYPNLFTYLTKHLKYSNGTAQRRIDVARLMKDFPALPEKLEAGELNLGQVSILQKALRQKKKETSTAVSKEEKAEIIENLMGRSEKETEILVAQCLDLELKESTQVHYQKDESVRLEITLTKEQWAKLERMREHLSNSLPDGSWDQVLEYVADKVIQQKSTVTQRAKPSSHRHLKETTKKLVRKRDQSCQICGTRWHLQTDHVRPRWDGGTHDLGNLQCLCGPHNRQRYREQAGIRHLS